MEEFPTLTSCLSSFQKCLTTSQLLLSFLRKLSCKTVVLLSGKVRGVSPESELSNRNLETSWETKLGRNIQQVINSRLKSRKKVGQNGVPSYLGIPVIFEKIHASQLPCYCDDCSLSTQPIPVAAYV